MFSKLIFVKIRYYTDSNQERNGWRLRVIPFYTKKKLIKYIKEEFEGRDLMIDDIKII